MPLPRLPDISLDSWIRDQQQQFERTISGLAEATEFKDAISDIESQVPADYPHPGGTDQWADAQRQQQEEEYRRQQDEDERRKAQQQADENQRQLDAYLNEKMRYEQEQQQQDALTQAQGQAQDLGIPSPDQAAASFQQIQPGDLPQPVQDFHSFADQIEQGQTPEGLQAPPPVKRGVPSPYSLTPPEEPLQAPPPLEEAPPPRRGVPSPYTLSPPPEPERPYWTPTAREAEGMGPAVGPDWLPEPIRQAAGVVKKGLVDAVHAAPQEDISLPTGRQVHVPGFAQQAVGSFSAAMEPVQAVDDYTAARLDPETWYFARDGIARTELDPGEFDRWNELQGSRRLAQGTKTTWTPEETAEIQHTSEKIDRIYQSIKDDPDKLNDYAKASPAYEITRGITHTVLGGALGNVVGGAAGSAARGLGAGHRAIKAAEYAGDIAAQTAFDPTTPAIQPLGDLALRGVGAGIRGTRSLAGRAGEALVRSADDVPEGVQRLGSGVSPEESRRFYHGTAGEFGRPDPGKFDEDGLFGPGYYLTSDPRVAGSYAETRGGRIPVDNPYTTWSKEAIQAGIDRAYKELEDPSLDFGTSRDIMDDLDLLEAARDDLVLPSPRSGPNVRAIDVPKNLNLLDLDKPVTADQAQRVIDATRKAGFPDSADELQAHIDMKREAIRRESTYRQPTSDPNIAYDTGQELHEELAYRLNEDYQTVVDTDLYSDKPGANRLLRDAGYDGMVHTGGKRVPLQDADGKPIEHDVTIVFPESLDKIRNAFSGEAGGSGVIPNLRRPLFNAAQGAFLGASSEELQAREEGRDADPARRLRSAGIGAGLAMLAGSRGARRVAGRALQAVGSGVVPEGAAQAARKVPVEFKTAKGSSYELLPDGTTIRNKAARSDPGHEGDFGIKPQSDATYFLTSENYPKLGLPEGPSRIVDHGDGTLSVATQNANGRWGIAPSSRNVPYETEPAVGLHPLEVWGPQKVNGLPAYKDVHFGNVITEVGGEAEQALARIPSETTMLEPPPRAGEEIASSVAAAENRIPEDLEQGYLPGMRPRTRRPSAAQQAEATVDQMREEVRGRYQDERRRFTEKEIWALAAKLRRTTPEKLQEILEGAQNMRGDEAATAGSALRQEGAALGEETRLVTEDWMRATQDLNDELRRRGIDPADLPARRDALAGKDPILNDLADEVEASVLAQAESMDRFEAWQRGDLKRGSSAALELRMRQKPVSARRAYRQLKANRSFYEDMQNTANELLAKGDQMSEADWEKLTSLQERMGQKVGSGELLDEVSGRRIRDIEREGIANVQAGKKRAGRAPKEAPPETLAERYGRLARRFDEYNAEGDTDAAQAIRSMMGDTVDEMKLQADERAIKILDQELPDAKTPEEGMKIIQKAVGDKVAQKLNKAALAAEDVREGPGGVDLSMKQWRDLQKLQRAFQNRIDRAFKAESNEQVRIALRAQMSRARDMMSRAIDDPTFAPALQEFRDRVAELRQQPGVGKTTGERLAKILEDQFTDRTAEKAFTQSAQDEVGLLQARIRGIRQQLDEAIKNKDAPGAQARVKELLQDMQDVGGVGKVAADRQRERLMRQNLHDIPGIDKSQLRDALATIDLQDPSSIRAVLDAMQNPTKWDLFRERLYQARLSNPWTWLTNFSSNVLTAGGHLGLQNPLERLYGGEAAGGSRAAWEEFKAARGEAGQRAWDVLKSGRSQQNLEQLASGDMGGLRREFTTEQGASEWYHRLSTRPLEAGDQSLGYMVYQSEIGKLAQRQADRLLKAGDARVQGMTPLEARKSIMTDIWDHPEIIEEARKIRDQVLLREHGSQGWERALQHVAAWRDPGLKPGMKDYARAAVMDFVLPFFNVPLNYARQGVQRSLGAPFYAYSGAQKLRAGDRVGAAQDFAKGTIGAAAMTSAAALYYGDALTGAGPDDPGDRAIWLRTHQPFSWKDPLGNWHSYQGTPLAIPFAIVAGAGEGWEKPGSTPIVGGEPMSKLAGGALGIVTGAGRGIASQSFLQGLSQGMEVLTNPNFSAGNAAQLGANLALTYGGAAGLSAGVPTLTGMAGFLASITDRMERDAGRPSGKDAGEFVQNVGARVASRIPVARWNLDPRIGAYGEPVVNQRSLQAAGPLALDPYWRGPAPGGNERISQDLGALGVGRPPAPDALTIQGYDVPLTIHEQREFDTVYGQTYREILDELEKSRVETTEKTGQRPVYSADLYLRLREAARKAARGQILATIPAADLEARLTRSIDQKLAAPRR